MTPPDSATSPWRQLTGYQWLVFVVAWRGWAGCSIPWMPPSTCWGWSYSSKPGKRSTMSCDEPPGP